MEIEACGDYQACDPGMECYDCEPITDWCADGESQCLDFATWYGGTCRESFPDCPIIETEHCPCGCLEGSGCIPVCYSERECDMSQMCLATAGGSAGCCLSSAIVTLAMAICASDEDVVCVDDNFLYHCGDRTVTVCPWGCVSDYDGDRCEEPPE